MNHSDLDINRQFVSHLVHYLVGEDSALESLVDQVQKYTLIFTLEALDALRCNTNAYCNFCRSTNNLERSIPKARHFESLYDFHASYKSNSLFEDSDTESITFSRDPSGSRSYYKQIYRVCRSIYWNISDCITALNLCLSRSSLIYILYCPNIKKNSIVKSVSKESFPVYRIYSRLFFCKVFTALGKSKSHPYRDFVYYFNSRRSLSPEILALVNLFPQKLYNVIRIYCIRAVSHASSEDRKQIVFINSNSILYDEDIIAFCLSHKASVQIVQHGGYFELNNYTQAEKNLADLFWAWGSSVLNNSYKRSECIGNHVYDDHNYSSKAKEYWTLKHYSELPAVSINNYQYISSWCVTKTLASEPLSYYIKRQEDILVYLNEHLDIYCFFRPHREDIRSLHDLQKNLATPSKLQVSPLADIDIKYSASSYTCSIVDTLYTVFPRLLALNLPVFLIVDKDIESVSLLDNLVNASIVHFCPKSLVFALKQFYLNPKRWWYESTVRQAAISEFLTKSNQNPQI